MLLLAPKKAVDAANAAAAAAAATAAAAAAAAAADTATPSEPQDDDTAVRAQVGDEGVAEPHDWSNNSASPPPDANTTQPPLQQPQPDIQPPQSLPGSSTLNAQPSTAAAAGAGGAAADAAQATPPQVIRARALMQHAGTLALSCEDEASLSRLHAALARSRSTMQAVAGLLQSTGAAGGVHVGDASSSFDDDGTVVEEAAGAAGDQVRVVKCASCDCSVSRSAALLLHYHCSKRLLSLAC